MSSGDKGKYTMRMYKNLQTLPMDSSNIPDSKLRNWRRLASPTTLRFSAWLGRVSCQHRIFIKSKPAGCVPLRWGGRLSKGWERYLSAYCFCHDPRFSADLLISTPLTSSLQSCQSLDAEPGSCHTPGPSRGREQSPTARD